VPRGNKGPAQWPTANGGKLGRVVTFLSVRLFLKTEKGNEDGKKKTRENGGDRTKRPLPWVPEEKEKVVHHQRRKEGGRGAPGSKNIQGGKDPISEGNGVQWQRLGNTLKKGPPLFSGGNGLGMRPFETGRKMWGGDCEGCITLWGTEACVYCTRKACDITWSLKKVRRQSEASSNQKIRKLKRRSARETGRN